MDMENIISWVFPVIILVAFWTYMLRRKKKESRNLFRIGQPIALNNRIEIESFISKEDFISAQQQLSIKLLLKGKMVVLFMFFVVSILGLNLLQNPTLVMKPSYIIPQFVPFIMIGVIFPVIYKYAIKYSAGRIYDTTEFMKGNVRYVFAPENYEAISPVMNTKSGWETIQGYLMLEKFILIYTGLSIAYFLNKSAFTSADLAKFEHFLENNFEVKKSIM